jgi:thioredoxin reductase
MNVLWGLKPGGRAGPAGLSAVFFLYRFKMSRQIYIDGRRIRNFYGGVTPPAGFRAQGSG